MRWTTAILGILLLCLVATLWVFVSPYIAALRSVHPTTDLATTLAHLLLSAKVSHAITQKTTWVLFALMGATVLVARIHISLPRRSTYGSSHYATWGEMWPYLKRRLHRLKKRQHRAKPQVILPESLFVIGKYRWQTIALTEKRQEEQ